MDAVEFLREKKRMCKSFNGGCSGCPLCEPRVKANMRCFGYVQNFPEKAVEIVENWSKKHPKKTILMDFLEKYPKAPMDEKGFPKDVCPFALGYEEDGCGVHFTDKCFDCWNRLMGVE